MRGVDQAAVGVFVATILLQALHSHAGRVLSKSRKCAMP